SWTGGLDRPNRPALGDVGPEWSMASPLRIDEDRRQALVEIDAIMAIVTGISIDDLVTIYRTQFAVLNDYDRGEGKNAYIFDANGRQIPSAIRTARNKAGRPETGLQLEDRTAVHPAPPAPAAPSCTSSRSGSSTGKRTCARPTPSSRGGWRRTGHDRAAAHPAGRGSAPRSHRLRDHGDLARGSVGRERA